MSEPAATDAAQALAAVQSLEDLVDVLAVVGRALGAEQAYVSWWHVAGGYVETVGAFGFQPMGDRFLLADYPLTRLTLEQAVRAEVDVEDPEADPIETQLLRVHGVRSLVMLPLVSRGRALGILELYDSAPRTPATLEREALVAGVLASTLDALAQAGEPLLQQRASDGSPSISVAAIVERHAPSRVEQAQRMEALGQLAGGVAHDFNNLLTVIANYAASLHAGLEDEELREEAAEIVDAARRAAELTGQLLTFSRHEASALDAVDLDALLAGLRTLLHRTLGEHLELRIMPAAQLPAVWVNPGRLEHALVNLAVNARDAMPHGGRLAIHVEEVEVGAFGFASSELPPGRYVRLSVADTGQGMSSDVAARAFDPFFTTKPRGKGTGLGLSTVYGTVRQAGGHIEVHSRPGHGTTVHMWLPVAAEAPAPGEPAPAPGAASEIRGTVLLVEDDEALRALAHRVLTRSGLSVIAAGDGAEGFDRFSSDGECVDVVVTDVVMPRLSGPDLADRIRAIDPTVPVVFISGYLDDERFGERLRGESRFVEKPFAAAALVGAVRDALGSRSAAG